MLVVGPVIAVLVGVLGAWWGWLCLRGRFPRNHLLGYRTVASLRDDDAWRAAQRGSAPYTLGGSAALVAAGVFAVVLALRGETQGVAVTVTSGVASLIASLIAGGFGSRRALRRRRS
ncbi:MAG: SdpI family protein [Microbacterium sp.]